MADDQLCSQIDAELVAYLRCIDEYQTAVAEVAACCKSGIFDIARARKSMGNRGMGVTELQYPKTMSAGSKIEMDWEKEEIVMLLTKKDYGSGGESKAEGSSLKSRGNKEEDEVATDEDSELLRDSRNGFVDESDPIRWFGVFAPQHLRTSQKTFNRSLHSVLNASRAIVEMKKHYSMYRELLAKKEKQHALKVTQGEDAS